MKSLGVLAKEVMGYLWKRNLEMSTSLKTVWKLWEKVEKGWESGEPEGEKLEGQKQPDKKDKSYKNPGTVLLQTKSPSGWNSLESEREFVPGNDKDAKVMQLETEIAKLEEALMEIELDEAFITPNDGPSTLGYSMFGGALEPPNGYDRNFCSDSPAPEENNQTGQDQDPSNALVARKQFVPKEELSKVMEALEWNRKTRLAKLF